jgi:hypothetical protein
LTDIGAPRSASRLDGVSAEALFVTSAVAQYVGAVIAVNLFDEVPPATVAWLRVVGAALALGAVSWRRGARRWTRAEVTAAAIFGIATGLMNLFFYLGIARIDLGPSVAIEFIGPITVAALRTRTRRNALALGLAVVGVLVLSGLELGGEPLGLVRVVGEEELERYVGPTEPAGRVDPRREPEADGRRVDGCRVDACRAHQRLETGSVRARERPQPAGGESAVLVDEGDDVGDGRERDEVEHRRKPGVIVAE